MLFMLLLIMNGNTLSRRQVSALCCDHSKVAIQGPIFTSCCQLTLCPTSTTKLGVFGSFCVSKRLQERKHFRAVSALSSHQAIFSKSIISCFGGNHVSRGSCCSRKLLRNRCQRCSRGKALGAHTSCTNNRLSKVCRTCGKSNSYQVIRCHTKLPIRSCCLLTSNDKGALGFHVTSSVPM